MQVQNLKKTILEVKDFQTKDYVDLYMDFVQLFQEYFKKQSLDYIASLLDYAELKKTSEEDIQKKVENLLAKVYNLGNLEESENFNRDLNRYGYEELDIVIDNEKAVEYAQRYAGQLIVGINETTQKQISTIITDGIKNGGTIQSISLDIQSKFTSYSLYRATLIAQQEVSTAYSKATRVQNDNLTERLGVTGWKRSQTQKDSNVRPSHKENEMEGWIPKNQSYRGTGTDIAPHDFGCRCHDEYSPVNPKTGLLYDNDETTFWGGYTDDQVERLQKNFGEISDYSFKIFKKEKDFVTEKGITNNELMVMKNYTNEGFQFYNSFYKKGLLSEEYMSSIKFMFLGLSKLESYEGAAYRGLKFKNKKQLDFMLSLKEGDIYKTDTFTSTSKSKKIAKQFVDSNNILLKVRSKNGKDIQPISTKKSEKEVLFLPRSLFVIEKIKKDGIFTIIEAFEI